MDVFSNNNYLYNFRISLKIVIYNIISLFRYIFIFNYFIISIISHNNTHNTQYMASLGTIQEYSNTITDDINNYYEKNSYIEFKPDPIEIMNNNVPSIAKRTPLKLMTKIKEYDTVTPVIMTLFDNNLYNIDTATYNTSLFFSKMKKEEQEFIRSGSTIITETAGLKYIIKPGYLLSVEDFLKSKYSTSSQIESFTASSQSSTTNNFNNKPSISVNDDNLSFSEKILKNLKNNIWGTDDNNNTAYKEGLAGLTYKSYSGYADPEITNKDYFNSKTLKTSGSLPITGTTTDFSSIGGITNSKVSQSTTSTMTTLTGYLYTDTGGGGVWTFSIKSDDMSRFLITDTNNVNESNSFTSSHVKLKIDNLGQHAMIEKSGTVALLANTYYKIDMTTGNNGGPGNLIFRYKSPGSNTWINNNSSNIFYTSIPEAGFNNLSFDSSKIANANNSSTLLALYETAKNSALSSTSSMTSTVRNNNSTFVMTNPADPNSMITVFPKIVSDGYQMLTGSLNDLNWSKIHPKTELSVEFFGYFKANVSGTYFLNIKSNQSHHISNLWIGDKALVNYTLQNADINNCGAVDSTGMFLSGQQEKTTNAIKVSAGQHYPIRIHYSQISSPTRLYNFNVYILKLDDDGSKRQVTNSTAYFCSLIDKNNKNYEPIQMAMALRNDKNDSNPALFNCYISPINTSNNYTNNENLRKVRGIESKLFKSFNLTPRDSPNSSNSKLTLTPNGDLVFNNGISSRSITGNTLTDESGSVKNSNCDNMCALPDYNTRSTIIVPGTPQTSDINLYNISVKENSDGSGEELLGKYVVLVSTVQTDPESGVKYSHITLSVDIKNYNLYNNGAKRDTSQSMTKTDTLDSCYVFYRIGASRLISVQLEKSADGKYFTRTISNLGEARAQYYSTQSTTSTPYDQYKRDYQTAMDVDATKCINSANKTCNFYSGITNDGEITISNSLGTLIWGSKQTGKLINNLGASYSPTIPDVSLLKSVNEWFSDAAVKNNYYIYSASYAKPFDTTPFLSTSIGKGQKYEVLYSPNGKYKLTLENGTLELKYAVNGENYTKLYTDNDGSQSFMLHLITADEKLGNVYLANSSAKTLYPLKNDKNEILKYANTFSQSTANSNYQYPPYNSSTSVINSTAYNKIAKSKTECEASCAGSDSCTHYYSYTTGDDKTWCMLNTDKSPEQYYNKIPELKSSNLYIRDRMIDSTCSYSKERCGDYKNVSTLTNSKSNTNDTFNTINAGYEVIYSRELYDGQTDNPSSEGACGVPAIYKRLANLVGPEENVGEYKFNNMNCNTEGFVSHPNTNIITEGFNVTGYTESNSCKAVNEYVNGIDVNPTNFSSMIQSCKTDLLKNVNVIEDYWTGFKNTNTKIDNNFKDIQSGTSKINTKSVILNNSENNVSKSLNYDPIDFSGNLLLSDEFQNSLTLKDGRIKDERENITRELILYMISVMALIAIFIFLIFTTSFTS